MSNIDILTEPGQKVENMEENPPITPKNFGFFLKKSAKLTTQQFSNLGNICVRAKKALEKTTRRYIFRVHVFFRFGDKIACR